MVTTSDQLARLKATNKIDGLVGAKEVGRILDLHNDLVKKKQEKEYSQDITDRNLYFYKLWLKAIDDMGRGERPKIKSKPTTIYLP